MSDRRTDRKVAVNWPQTRWKKKSMIYWRPPCDHSGQLAITAWPPHEYRIFHRVRGIFVTILNCSKIDDYVRDHLRSADYMHMVLYGRLYAYGIPLCPEYQVSPCLVTSATWLFGINRTWYLANGQWPADSQDPVGLLFTDSVLHINALGLKCDDSGYISESPTPWTAISIQSVQSTKIQKAINLYPFTNFDITRTCKPYTVSYGT